MKKNPVEVEKKNITFSHNIPTSLAHLHCTVLRLENFKDLSESVAYTYCIYILGSAFKVIAPSK